VPHPGADEVIQSQENDWRKVVDWLTEYEPPGKTIFYQKHMTHHLLPEIDRGWLDRLTHTFLLREPREVVTSFIKIAGTPKLEETGLPQQLEIFRWVRDRTGRTPPVVDSRDVLENPRRVLGLLCDALDIQFTDTMLSWPAGPRETDGVWAKYWYESLLQSTTFQPYKPKNEPVPPHLTGVLREAEDIYAQLYEHRLH
jgi:hypothetical protein